MDRPYAGHDKDDLLKRKKTFERAGFKVAEINAELKQRELEANIKKLSNPHWSLNPTFWLVLVSTILTFISTAILIFQFLQSYSQDQKSGSSTHSEQTSSEDSAPTVIQSKPVSQPTISQVMKKNFAVTKQPGAVTK